MKNIVNINIAASDNIKYNIFREFQKKGDNFIATNRFYISDEDENGNYIFTNTKDYHSNNEKIIPYNKDIFILKNNKNLSEKYLDLVLLSNIILSLEDVYINCSQLIKNILSSGMNLDDKLSEDLFKDLFKDLYFNEKFSKKINIELPVKYNNKKVILEDMDIEKKYLFKINIVELNRSFYQYKQ
jgi:hypothetical protein